MKRDYAHANHQPAHWKTSREGKRRTGNFVLRVSNLSLHKASNWVSEFSQVTNADPKGDFSCLLKIAPLKNISICSSFLHLESFFNYEFRSLHTPLRKSNLSNERFSEKSLL